MKKFRLISDNNRNYILTNMKEGKNVERLEPSPKFLEKEHGYYAQTIENNGLIDTKYERGHFS